MPSQEMFELTSFEIASEAVLGRIFEDVILCIRFTLAAACFIHSQLQRCACTTVNLRMPVAYVACGLIPRLCNWYRSQTFRFKSQFQICIYTFASRLAS